MTFLCSKRTETLDSMSVSMFGGKPGYEFEFSSIRRGQNGESWIGARMQIRGDNRDEFVVGQMYDGGLSATGLTYAEFEAKRLAEMKKV